MITRTTEHDTVDLISLYDAADQLGVSHQTVKRFVVSHKLPAYRLPNGEFRLSRRELREWVRSLFIPAAEAPTR